MTPSISPKAAFCAVCGAAFAPKSKTAGRKTETCSQLCGNRLRGSRAALRNKATCAVCDKSFTPKSYKSSKDGKVQRTETCSWRCGIVLRWRRTTRHVSQKQCVQCGKAFCMTTLGRQTTSRNWGRQRFCGYDCVYKSRRKNQESGQ